MDWYGVRLCGRIATLYLALTKQDMQLNKLVYKTFNGL